MTALSKSLLAAIDADRAKRHLAALKLDRKQSSCSARHSRHMAEKGVISHDQFPTDVCVPHVWAAENVGVAFGDPTQAPLLIHKLMMAEGPCPRKKCTGALAEAHGHYLNLMNRLYKRVGIGLYIRNGVWLTEDLTS